MRGRGHEELFDAGYARLATVEGQEDSLTGNGRTTIVTFPPVHAAFVCIMLTPAAEAPAWPVQSLGIHAMPQADVSRSVDR